MGLADRLAAALTTRIAVGSASIPLSSSIGVAIYPDDVSPRVDIYKAADQALFAAKADGKGCVRRFDPQMREQKESHRRLVARVKEGLRRGEFVPYFQPKFDLVSGSVVGFEALCRWQHPQEGVLLPGAFWEAFDDPEVGGTLSDVTLVGSFDAARRFRERALPFGHVAINLSRLQLERNHLADQVRALQEEYGVAAEEVVFEVLENVLIRDERNVYRNLTELYRLGFRVALDDFGTGFASLTHIREPFIREVKIDRSFVTDVASDPHDLQIVAAIVQMARKLGLTLVAEGIEDEETVRRLAALGCTVGQGFVFSKALPFEEAMEFLGRQSRIASLVDGRAGQAEKDERGTVTSLPRRASL
jgi:EAL domain-containing protein (putative c-di-GMP-specific phosphodiesterase class I)